MFEGITPVHRMGGYYVKRDDLAYWSDLKYPSGSKVRQYLSMAWGGSSTPSSAPCIVGCSANSAMQIYVAAAAAQLGTQGIIYTASRKKMTDATKYAAAMGAEINLVKPGYLSLIRQRARIRMLELSSCVRWNPGLAFDDTFSQCQNMPDDVKRIIVPTGSGLTVAAVLAGVTVKFGHKSDTTPTVIAMCVSDMFDAAVCYKRASDAAGATTNEIVQLEVIPAESSYNKHEVQRLPDGTPLDPFYAAKAFKHVREGDLFWLPGLRPVISMPDECQEAFKDWKGPKE